MGKPKASTGRGVLAENIRVERARRRLSQEALADLAGMSRVYLGTIERGEVACSIDMIERIAKALDMTMAELVSAGPKGGS